MVEYTCTVHAQIICRQNRSYILSRVFNKMSQCSCFKLFDAMLCYWINHVLSFSNSAERASQGVYEEIRDSRLDAKEAVNESFYDDEEKDVDTTPSDVINYYIQPVNEYENTVLILYENYMESQGYQDPVCEKDKCTDNNDDGGYDKKSDDDEYEKITDDEERCEKNSDDDGYEIPLETLTYDILSNSPVELFLFVDKLDPES